MHTFWQRGYFATSMQDIEAITGLKKMSLYNVYGNKESMFEKSMDLYESKMKSHLKTAEYNSANGFSAIKLFFEGMLKEVLQDKNNYGCFLCNSIIEFSGTSPDFHKRVDRRFDQLKSKFMEFIERGQIDGTLHTKYRSETICDYLVSFYQGLMADTRSNKKKEKYMVLLDLGLEPIRSQ